MKNLIIFSISLFFSQMIMAQSSYDQDVNDTLSKVPDFQGQEKLQQLVPSMAESELEKKTATDEQEDGMSILGRSDHIFPKSKVSDQINPIFKGSSFAVEGAKKRSSNMDFSPAISGSRGTNEKFRNNETFKNNQLPDVEIPEELKELFEKKSKP